jgi:F420H(2)-dependent quinone reductase
MTEPAAAGLEGLTRKQQNYFLRGRRMALRHPKNGPRMFSNANRTVFRLTGGRFGSTLVGVPVGLLTTTGRSSGHSRTVPIIYLDEGSHFLVAASNSGFDAPPAWYLNLRADPSAEIRTRAGTSHVVARELAGPEREEAWRRLVAHNPFVVAYQSCTQRQIAVLALEQRQSQDALQTVRAAGSDPRRAQ